VSKKIDLKVEFETAIGAFKPTREGRRDFRIMTKLGALDVSLHDDDDQPWIAAVWDDVERARAHFGVEKTFLAVTMNRLNPFSGKWNWHWFQQRPYRERNRKADRIEAGRKMIAAFVEKVQGLA
jgi:hypothetical protein